MLNPGLSRETLAGPAPRLLFCALQPMQNNNYIAKHHGSTE